MTQTEEIARLRKTVVENEEAHAWASRKNMKTTICHMRFGEFEKEEKEKSLDDHLLELGLAIARVEKQVNDGETYKARNAVQKARTCLDRLAEKIPPS